MDTEHETASAEMIYPIQITCFKSLSIRDILNIRPFIHSLRTYNEGYSGIPFGFLLCQVSNWRRWD